MSINVEPAHPWIEIRDGEQRLNFDFSLRNQTHDSLRIAAIEMEAFDASGHLALKKTVNSDGLRPGIDVVAPELLGVGQTTDIFNPFFSIADGVPVTRLDYEFRFLVENTPKQAKANRHRLPMDFDLAAKVSVVPSTYQTRTALVLPLHGRVLVWEGHDFFAHHRRIPLDSEKARSIGLAGTNANRYASDFVIVNERGQMFHDDPYHKKNYYSYGQPIYAPADGVVRDSRNDIPDNEFEGPQIRYPKLPPGASDDLGNFVLLDHQDGEFSVFPHMRIGSVRVKPGNHVRRGDLLGEVGFSGDAIFPHVHFALLSGPDVLRDEGVPAYFDQFDRILGGKRVPASHATLDTGDIVESTVPGK